MSGGSAVGAVYETNILSGAVAMVVLYSEGEAVCSLKSDGEGWTMCVDPDVPSLVACDGSGSASCNSCCVEVSACGPK